MAFSLLAYPALYVLSQRLVGADLAREIAIEELMPSAGQSIIDIGCGPAYYFDRLPACDYFGFDTDAASIASATRRFGNRGRFFAEPYTEARRKELPPANRVMLMGLLHHLDDADCDSLLSLVARSLGPGGRVVALDTVLFNGQSTISRLLSKNDRGDFVRYPESFLELAKRHFAKVDHRIIGQTWRMPGSYLLMTLGEPR